MELISVIVPIYKAEQYLDRCILSIIHQTYQNLEIILVDDGSPDQCPEMCDKWAQKDERIKAIHQKNSGVSVARNTGISNSSGRYIMMVDSDDYLCSEMIASLCQALEKNGTDLALCEFEKGKQDSFEFTYQPNGEVEIIDSKLALERIYINSEKALQYVAPWGKLYKRELFEGISYPKGKIFEDIYVTHQLLYRCRKIAVIPQKLIYYYQHADSIMNKKYHVGKLDYLDAVKDRISFFAEHGLNELEEIAYDEYLHSLIWEYSRARDLLADKEVMKDIVDRFRSIYHKGYASKRYPKETAMFLRAFYMNPELIIWYWRIRGKMESLFGRKHE